VNAVFARSILGNVGIDVAIGYGVFLVLAFFAGLVSTGGFADDSVTLVDLLSGDVALAALSGSNGKGSFLVLFATATIAVPYLWKHKFAPLAFAVPLLFTIHGLWPLYAQHRAQQQAMEAMGELGQAMGQMAGQMGSSTGGPFDSLGIGAWLLLATVIFLAFRGVMRCLART
jgi:hypothetical protein